MPTPRSLIVPATAIVSCMAMVLGVAPARSQETPDDGPLVVTITEQDLPWHVGDHGAMGWASFGAAVNPEQGLCSNVAISGPIATLRLDLRFDLAGGTLTGSISGTMRRHDEGEFDWATGSFDGAISNGWVEEAPSGWAWGGESGMTLTFTAVRTCAEILGPDDSVIERITAETEEPHTLGLPVEFSGGAIFETGEPGFVLDGEVPGSDPEIAGGAGWHLSIICFDCAMPVLFGDAGAPAGIDDGGAPDTAAPPDGDAARDGERTEGAATPDDAADDAIGSLLVWTALVLGAAGLIAVIWLLMQRARRVAATPATEQSGETRRPVEEPTASAPPPSIAKEQRPPVPPEEARSPVVRISKTEVQQIIDWGLKHNRPPADLENDIDARNEALGGSGKVPIPNPPTLLKLPEGHVTVTQQEADAYEKAKHRLQECRPEIKRIRRELTWTRIQVDRWITAELSVEARWMAGVWDLLLEVNRARFPARYLAKLNKCETAEEAAVEVYGKPTWVSYDTRRYSSLQAAVRDWQDGPDGLRYQQDCANVRRTALENLRSMTQPGGGAGRTSLANRPDKQLDAYRKYQDELIKGLQDIRANQKVVNEFEERFTRRLVAAQRGETHDLR